jgi:hypothetical protein
MTPKNYRHPRRPDKPFRTNNPKYSFYHLIERKPVEISFLAMKCMHFGQKMDLIGHFLEDC